MARPLTKVDANGVRYTRPPVVEAQIDELVQLDFDDLRARLGVTKPDDPGYVRSECMVYLLREYIRTNDPEKQGVVLIRLLSRCEKTLLSKIPDGMFATSSIVREEVLGQLAELFAKDNQNPGLADLYEAKFNLAFRSLYVSEMRKEYRRPLSRTEEALDEELGDSENAEGSDDDTSSASKDSEEDVRSALADFMDPATGALSNLPENLRVAIEQLPLKERKALILCEVIGLKRESIDKQEITAATICGCEGKTIRNHLRSAKAKLAKFKEKV